jgi:hypothetical protein
MSETADRRTLERGLPAVRMGLLAGVTGLLCCVGPTVLALLGVVSAGTAFVWANDLYDGYAWFPARRPRRAGAARRGGAAAT